MLLTCPICRAECTVDDLSVDTVTCPTCGQQLSTRTGTPVGSTPDAKDETRKWDQAAVAPTAAIVPQTANIDVLPVRMGRYFIESLIAQGGFAKVYLATDEELGRRVALKIPRLEKFPNPAKLRLFLTEARIAAKLRHPGIVTIFDVGQFTNGPNYIAMEYVAGEPLAHLIDAGRIPIPQAVDLLIKVAEAVHDAHRQGLVHRDLKPSNILLDERGQPRVVDFGLAVHETTQDQFKGEVAGTPPYMSPEQFRGEVHRMDGRTDIWSLGVVLYQLLTGRRPFNGDVVQLNDEVLYKAPKPPRQIDDQIPRELEAICFKCLSKSVDDRYSTAKDLADDLRGWAAQKPVGLTVADPSSRTLHTDAPRRRFPRVTLVAILSLIIFTGLFAAVMGLTRTRSIQQLDHNFDHRVRLHDWITLLDAKAVPLAWDATHEAYSWKQHEQPNRIVVDCGGAAFLSVGQTHAADYSLQCTIGRSHWENRLGGVGLFLGYQPMVTPEGASGHRCLVVFCVSDNEKGKLQHWLQLQTWDLINVTNRSSPSMQITGCSSVSIPKPDVQNVLEVSVRRGTLRQIKWQSVDYPILLQECSYPVVAPVGKESQVGIINYLGSATFSDVRFKLLESIPKPAKEIP